VSVPDANDFYAALIGNPDRLRRLRRLQYRCPERCLLLDAVAVGDTVLLHQKRYKLSRHRNAERSSDSGRTANTYDGENHWKPRSYYIETSALALTDAEGAILEIQCDHVNASMKPSDFAGDWESGHTEVRVRADGSRFPVG